MLSTTCKHDARSSLVKIHQLSLLVEIMVVALSETGRHLGEKMTLSCRIFL